MDENIRKSPMPADVDEKKMEAYRYWQSRPVHERIARVCDLSLELYAMKGQTLPKMDKTLIRVERPNEGDRTS
jgi:hypothetical protein